MALRDGEAPDDAILLALLDRETEGMTIFELRNRVSADIDSIESALERLKDRGLIEIERTDGRVLIRPTSAAVDAVDRSSDESTWLDQIRERLPF